VKNMLQTKESIIQALLDVTKNVKCQGDCGNCYLGHDNCVKLREVIDDLESEV
jgi:hypothetical protein